MKEIEPEGVAYVYFTQADGLPNGGELGLELRRLDPYMERQLPASRDFRLVLVKLHTQPDVGLVYYLYWNDGRDLTDLDRNVEEGTYTDGDFANAVKTVYQRTRCMSCGCTWHTLVIPPGDPYVGVPGLLEAKIAKSHLLRCPNCGASLRQLVVKIFPQDT